MQVVIGVKFNSTQKVYFFDPQDISFAVGDGVIVETARGTEFGTVMTANHEVEDKEIVAPLKPVIRKATEGDIKQNADNLAKKQWVIKVCQDKIQQHNLVMKLVDAEYTFDRSKAIFIFTAEGRVDFRELVRDLASVLKTRIELRQIYERDDIKLRGALAPCGRICCCHNHLRDFEKVSIKMAKNQSLSLNPQKISGVCGKLMCCLKYENDYYVETNKLLPKVGSNVHTVHGVAKVESVDVLRRKFKGKIETDDGDIVLREFTVEDIDRSDKRGFHSAEIDDDDDDSEK